MKENPRNEYYACANDEGNRQTYQVQPGPGAPNSQPRWMNKRSRGTTRNSLNRIPRADTNRHRYILFVIRAQNATTIMG